MHRLSCGHRTKDSPSEIQQAQDSKVMDSTVAFIIGSLQICSNSSSTIFFTRQGNIFSMIFRQASWPLSHPPRQTQSVDCPTSSSSTFNQIFFRFPQNTFILLYFLTIRVLSKRLHRRRRAALRTR